MGSNPQENPDLKPGEIIEKLGKTFPTPNPEDVIAKIISKEADYLDIICLLPTIHQHVLNSAPKGTVIGAEDFLPATIEYLESFLKKGDKLDPKYIDLLCEEFYQFKKKWDDGPSAVVDYLNKLKERNETKETKIIKELESQEEKSILALIVNGLALLAFGIAVLALSGCNPIGWSFFSVGVATLFWGFCLDVKRSPLLPLLPFEKAKELESQIHWELLNKGEVAYYFTSFIGAITQIAHERSLKVTFKGIPITLNIPVNENSNENPMVLTMNFESSMTPTAIWELENNLQTLVDELNVEGVIEDQNKLISLKIGNELIPLADCTPEGLLATLQSKHLNCKTSSL